MKRFVEGQDRAQSTLFPECLEDWIETLVDRVKAEVPRCLPPEQRQRLFLAPTPPRWCIDMNKWPYDGT